MPAVYNALNGQEVAQIIGLDVAKALDAHPDLRGHITYPVIEWEWTLTVRAYPCRLPEFDVKRAGECRNDEEFRAYLEKQVADARALYEAACHQRQIREEAAELTDATNPTVIVMQGVREKIDTPDAVREEVGLPVLEARNVGVQTADVPTHRGKGRRSQS